MNIALVLVGELKTACRGSKIYAAALRHSPVSKWGRNNIDPDAGDF